MFFKYTFQIVCMNIVRMNYVKTVLETVLSEAFMKVNEPNLNVGKSF
jgi:hypothetical protein